MMSIKKRILLVILFYVLNVGFSLLCIGIASRGYWSTIRYEWTYLIQLAAGFFLISFEEMCLVMHRYHRKRNAFGTECIPLDSREILQSIGLGMFYTLSFMCSFRKSVSEECFWMFLLAALFIVVSLMCGSARYLWIDGDKRYVVNEIGEVYRTKTLARSGEDCIITYVNDKKKERKIKVKQNNRIKEFFGN